MTVKEAINLFAYGEAFYIQGAYSGKIYHKSYENKKDHLEKFLDERVSDTPFFLMGVKERSEQIYLGIRITGLCEWQKSRRRNEHGYFDRRHEDAERGIR